MPHSLQCGLFSFNKVTQTKGTVCHGESQIEGRKKGWKERRQGGRRRQKRMSAVIRAVKEIASKAAEHSAVLVAFSGGKDSLAVLDLCRRAFRRVECFHFELVPGLAVTNARVAEPLKKLGVPCRYYRDPRAVDALRRGVFCDQSPACDRLKATTEKDVYQSAMRDAGIDLVATGKKFADYRQRAFHMRGGRIFGWHPLREWRKADVVGYLKARGIAIPPSHAEAGGIDLTAASLRWMHAEHPDDFRIILKWFPYAETVIIRDGIASEIDEARGIRGGDDSSEPIKEGAVQSSQDFG